MEWATNEERDRLAKEEVIKVLDWDNEECGKVLDKLEAEGRLLGMDGVYPEIDAIHKEGKRQIKQIYKKYYSEKY